MADNKGGLSSVSPDEEEVTAGLDAAAPSKATIKVGGMNMPLQTAISSEVLRSLQDEIARRQNDKWGDVTRGLAQAGAFSINRPDLASNIQQQAEQEQQNVFNMKAQLAAIKAAQALQRQGLQSTQGLLGGAPAPTAGGAPTPAPVAGGAPTTSPLTGDPIPPNVAKVMQLYLSKNNPDAADTVFKNWSLENAKQKAISENRPEQDTPQDYFFNGATHRLTPRQVKTLGLVVLPDGTLVTPEQASSAAPAPATAAPMAPAAAPAPMAPAAAPMPAAPPVVPASTIAGGPLPPGMPLPSGPMPSGQPSLSAMMPSAPTTAPLVSAVSSPDFDRQVKQKVTEYAKSLPTGRNPKEVEANIEAVKNYEKGLRETEQKRLEGINATEQKRIQDLNSAMSKSTEESSKAAGISAGKIFDLADRAPDVIAKADYIINHAKEHPNEFGWSYKDTSKSALAPVLSAMTAIPGHLVEPAAERLAANFAGPGVAERRAASDRAATQLAMDQAAQMFVGSGARLGVGLEQMVQNSKGVGTENPAFVNIVNANFIKLGYQKAQAIAAAMNAHPEMNKNQLMQSPIGQKITAEFNTKLDAMEDDLKKVYPDAFGKTPATNRPPLESFRRKP